MTHTLPQIASSDTETTDVIIIGGGLVGGALAAALATHRISTVLIDREDIPTQTGTGYDGRCSAIAAGCQSVLEGAGVWRYMDAQAQPILDIRIVDEDSPLFLHYNHEMVAQPMGWVVENRVTRVALHVRCAELENLKILSGLSVAKIERSSLRARVTLTDGRVVSAPLLVGADGRQSQVRNSAGLKIFSLPYHQSGIVLTVHHEKPHRGVAHEKFRPAGPFAILPLAGGHHSSLVWTEETRIAQAIVALPEAEFQAILEDRFGSFLGRIRPASPRFQYPLSLQVAERFIDHRVALVGDAAHGMHPVAGQGMNYGLRDVAALAEKIVEARSLGLDIGSETVLKAYQSWRRRDTFLMLGVTDGIVRLFSNTIVPIRWARRLGLAMVNHLPSLKHFFILQAMGRTSDVPKMMRKIPLL